MSRLRSYTVIEMLVVMLVSTLSIGIAYSCYMIIGSQHRVFTKNAKEISSLVLLDRLLTTDIARASYVVRTVEGFDCVAANKNVTYQVFEEFVIRKEGIVDTFFFKQQEEPLYLKDNEKENIPGVWLNQVQLSFVYKEEKLYFYYTKLYGADLLMNQDETTTTISQ